MKTSQKGIDLIKAHEGCRLEAYVCPAGKNTIGYGHTGKDVFPGMNITQGRAEDLLAKDLERFEVLINQFVTSPINQDQFDALVSFTYNIGGTAFINSTLLKVINKAPDDWAVGTELMRWIRGGGKVLDGLVNRRKAECDLYFSKV